MKRKLTSSSVYVPTFKSNRRTRMFSTLRNGEFKKGIEIEIKEGLVDKMGTLSFLFLPLRFACE